MDTGTNTPHTETVTSHVQGRQATSSSQLTSSRTYFLEHPEEPLLILRLPKRFVNRSSWFDFPEKRKGKKK